MSLFLHAGRPRILDGAMGTELIARGLDQRSDIAERWVLTRPEIVTEIHSAYAAAGAEAVQTCTFGALRARLSPHALATEVTRICDRAVQLAREAAPGVPVIASLGPTGLIASAEHGHDAGRLAEIESQVAEAAQALAKAGADVLHLETQYHPAELLAAAAGAHTAGLPLWISVTVVNSDVGLTTPHGIPFDRMIRALEQAAPNAVGVNCSLDAERIRGAVERLVGAGLGPVVARPQARISEKCATGRSRESAARFAERAALLFAAGATAVGGCCGTGPASIAALKNAVAAGPMAEGTPVIGTNAEARR